MDSISYYDKNSKDFYDRTINADVQDLYQKFLRRKSLLESQTVARKYITIIVGYRGLIVISAHIVDIYDLR